MEKMSPWLRAILLAVAILIVFGATAAIMNQVLPGPRTRTDFFLIGCVSTSVAMLVLFIVLLNTWVKLPDTFFKRRKK